MAAINVTDLSNAKLDVDHIADVANSSAPTVTDRLGNVKDTVKGAVDTLKAFNSRGAWVTATAYAVKDLVSNGGQWYACVTAHTSSASFATDSPTKWRVHQGATFAELAVDTGSDLIGNGGESVADSFNALQLADYASLRAYAGPRKSVYTTGYLVSSAPSGIAGDFVRDDSDTTSADNGGTIIVAADGTRWKRQFEGPAFVEWFGAVGGAVVDDWAAIQATTNFAESVNGAVGFGPRNYLVSAPIVVSGTFRSVRFQGSNTGNHQTASSAGTCLVSSATGNNAIIRAEFLTFANENISIDGISFYNPTLSTNNGGYAVKIVRGASNGRYVSGFRFSNIGAQGFAACIGFQGLNTANADNNFFGNVLFENVSAQGCGFGLELANASLNLATLSNVLFFNCPFGGIKCVADGEVTPGTGKGSIFIGTLTNKTHMEGVGGMFRTCPTPVLDSLGNVIRNSITLNDFSHEGCGSTIGPVAGEPYALGVNTDIHVSGFVIDGLSFGEVLLPYLNSTARLWCDSRMRVVCNGGRIMTPRSVNAPTLTATAPVGGSANILVPLVEPTGFCLDSCLLLDDGSRGYIKSIHRGQFGAAKTTDNVAGTAVAGITVVWATTADGNAIDVTINNATGLPCSAELQVENLSSASITVASTV